ncbi:hypothetical protein [Mesoplasma lactucae]|uniref:Uncharacterized protein n=1 Tax=Mesoplasma lactucae ATCC 49193 TaxID=81460 RepID=A0A291IR74_9MOLU|nr:hypothetical protein [Mesoplasma lactucae]ATG97273.1 hypothetical protein CP520_00675 [Mesoplasma lactucae ATCC 49193]ATZ20277.1 hypothetical protein MLACT_v1c04560 [Mesoplasma lactucae ATCC 49193]MCL8216448.1 hypothetical protein [Mesoplasma lactucae ATCC 49193]
MKNLNVKTRRFLASFINWVCIVPIFINIILWCFNKEPIGQRLFNTEGFQKGSRLERFVFGLLSLIVFATIIGFIVNIFFWAKDEDSIPVRWTKAIFKNWVKSSTKPTAKADAKTTEAPKADAKKADAKPASAKKPAAKKADSKTSASK